MIGIICPSKFEYEALNLKNFPRSKAVLVKSGMGKLRAAHACHLLKKKNPKIDVILLIGFAGGLTESLKVGDLIEPNVFIEQDYNAEPFEKFPNRIRSKSGKIFKDSKSALMLTQDRFLTHNPYKQGALSKKYRFMACDMEAYAVAHFCRQEKVNFYVLKLISDSADEAAEHDFLKACRMLKPKLNQLVLEAIEKLC